MSHLEQALRDLEIATAALAENSGADAEIVRAILDRRSQAIARVLDLKDATLALPAEERDQIIQRMRYAAGAGELTQLRMAGSQRELVAEWSHWNQIHRSLAAGSSPDARKVDCSG
jgi:ABC-type transporter Mla subunit MlaD